MDKTTAERAQETMTGLLDALGIKRVISVDDFNADLDAELNLTDASDVTGQLLADDALLAPVVQILTNLDPQLGFDRVNPDEVGELAAFLTENWQVLPKPGRLALVQATTTQREGRDSVAEAELADDVGAPELLREFLSGASQFKQYSLAEWRQHAAAELQDVSPVLILVDRNFSREPEAGGTGDRGEQLLEEILANGSGHVHAGLLTREAIDGTSERAFTERLRQRFAGSADRVLAIGKFRLKEPEQFPAAVRTLLLVSEIREFRELARTALSDAHRQVLDSFEQLEDHTLIGAMSVAQREGSYELEHPLRLSQRRYHELLIEAVRTPQAQALLPRLRDSAVAKYLTADRPGEQIRELQHADTFEPTEAFNTLGLPLEVGDIFERTWAPQGSSVEIGTGEGGHFVLLAQACDLSIRRHGARPNVLELVLHPVEPLDEAELKAKPNKRALYHPLGQLRRDGQLWGVRYTGSITVPAEALDATVFRSDGRATLTPRAPDKRPHSAGWEERQKVLINFSKSAINRFAEAERQVKDLTNSSDLLTRLAASFGRGSIDHQRGVSVRIDSTAKILEFGLRRVARIRSDVAINVASLALAYAGRPAFELESVPAATA